MKINDHPSLRRNCMQAFVGLGWVDGQYDIQHIDDEENNVEQQNITTKEHG